MHGQFRSKYLLLSLITLLFPTDSFCQGNTLLPLPERRETLLEARDTASTAASRTEIANSLTAASDAFFGWDALKGSQAVAFWGNDRARLLPGSSLTVGSGTAALYTEIGAVTSGTFRFSVGTTISAAAEENEAEETEVESPQAGFERFVAGGGSLSMTVIRPLALRDGTYADQYFYIVPRAWANVPTLSDAENIEDLGSELALEYQYHRFQTGAETETAPFLVFAMRVGYVTGSENFFETIGKSDLKSFFYAAPTATFVLQEVIKLGITTFIAPSTLSSQGKVRLNLTLLNKAGNGL